MDKFAKSILNYYAAFTETSFNFGKKIDYIWADDATSLNFSVFPEFQKKILNNIKNGQKINFKIKKDEYTVKADAEKYKKDFIDIIDKEFNEDYLKKITKIANEDSETDVSVLEGLQDSGRTYIIKAVEIKSDDDKTEVTNAKNKWGKMHFSALNKLLDNGAQINIEEEFKKDLRAFYSFELITPEQFTKWFADLRSGRV